MWLVLNILNNKTVIKKKNNNNNELSVKKICSTPNFTSEHISVL